MGLDHDFPILTVPVGHMPEPVGFFPKPGGELKRPVGLAFRDYQTEADSHVEHLEHFRVGDSAKFLKNGEDRRRRRERIDHERDPGRDAAQVQEPVAGNVHQGLDVDVLFRFEERQDFLRVDMRRLEQCFTQGPAEFGKRFFIQGPVLSDRLSCQGETVAVHPVAFNADDHVARANTFPHDDPVQIHDPDGRPRQIEPFSLFAHFTLDDVLDLSNFPTGDGDAGAKGSLGQSLCQFPQADRIERLHRNIVHHGQRGRPDAEQIIHVHGDAIDADGVVFPHPLGNQDLGPHAIRSHGDSLVVADLDHVGEQPEVQTDTAGLSLGDVPRLPELLGNIGKGLHDLVGIDPGPLIGYSA